jgi:predicted enzyme related to lactoylglutathione lyase
MTTAPTLNFILLHVDDVAAVRPFYTEKLGLAVLDEQPGFVQFARPDGSGASLALTERAATTKPTQTVELWWYVDDADAAHADLADRGVEIASPPTDMPFGRTFSIHDPAGHTLFLLQLAPGVKP